MKILRALMNRKIESFCLGVVLTFLACSGLSVKDTLHQTRSHEIKFDKIEQILIPIEVPPLLQDPLPRWQYWANDLWTVQYCTGIEPGHDHVNIGLFYQPKQVTFLFLIWIQGDPVQNVTAWIYVEGQPVMIPLADLEKQIKMWLTPKPPEADVSKEE